MPVDNCAHNFSELSEKVLPKHLEQLRHNMKDPWRPADFCRAGAGVAAILKDVHKDSDFAGCYVIVENNQPIYVGISRKVIARLRQHVVGKTHFDASLAYRLAQKRLLRKTKRSDAMADAKFYTHFVEAQAYLRRLHCAFVPIANPLERYLFEVFCAMEFGTSDLNTFETH